MLFGEITVLNITIFEITACLIYWIAISQCEKKENRKASQYIT